MKIDPKIFRAYDVRGTYPDQMNEDSAYRIAKAYAKKINPKKVVVGQDLREASTNMKDAVIRGLTEMGVDVFDAGEMTNPMIGFAVFNYGYDGGIILSASHNPVGYGGMKMMKKNAVTIPGDDEDLISYALQDLPNCKEKGKVEKIDIIDDYVKFVLTFIDKNKLKKKKILFDTTYGSVSLILDKILNGLPVDKISLHDRPDKNFGGLPEPNPLNREVQQEAVELAKKERPDFAVMWDGDGDRVFFLDENAQFIPAPYISAALIKEIAKLYPSQSIVGDRRINWPLKKAAEENGLKLLMSKSGYRFFKEVMGDNNSSFGAEMSAHYFFEKTKYMDNGIIPFLMMWQLVSQEGKKLSEIVRPYRANHFMIDEMKFPVEDIEKVNVEIKKKYSGGKLDEEDGVTIEFPDWRFNFRGSNTEPVAKLNLEARDEKLMLDKTQELKRIIESC